MEHVERTTVQSTRPFDAITRDFSPNDPTQIGRYRIEKVLGEGGFGKVYLARDEQLQRSVAIKVPHANLVIHATDADAYLAEARMVASLDHPQIVPVYDVGSADGFPCFVVSKYIDGSDLATRLKQSRPSYSETATFIASVAEALDYAHKQGLVHRDIKPGNILLDKNGKPYVGDFGLALREQDVGQGPRYAGTPAYMSPEQARGEGHRVDGRSDIFSLGVVFYEMLVGRRPFISDSRTELLELITKHEPRPPLQFDDSIPLELERICLKTLSKRASDRYSTAKELAEDLQHYLNESFTKSLSAPTTPLTPTVVEPGKINTPANTPPSNNRVIKIVPKGLRSFDAHDADFFLELLPGPRDRDGLPDSIRFWKTRIEQFDADATFTVGLIYGPSGCGKSSLVKAGLLPRLSGSVISVYVEAAGEETESRLLYGLRKRCPALADNMGLKDTLAALRRGQGIPPGKKVLIVLDQFEQWLHAKKDESNTELAQALRQCDGGRLQCIVMVRDDFWLAVSRFMRDLEVRLIEGQNSTLVDLFDLDHGRKVLAAFGRAFGKLPERISDTNRDQKQFLEQSVADLAQEGKVISVRLALFAEMMKGKSWTPAALKAVGGTEGVGVTFLEETFSESTAPPEHRYHQKAARGVLKALLPESGTDIKGHMRSYEELLEASGYAKRTQDFHDLVHILDSEIRLITPTEPKGNLDEEFSTQALAGQKYYQLTHDYLVPSLRDWLTRKQKETRRGRAELLLADRAAVWNARPENRQLPSFRQWLSIRLLTSKNNWTIPQRRMMDKASKHQLFHILGLFVTFILLSAGFGQLANYALRDRLMSASTAEVPAIISDMRWYRIINPFWRFQSKSILRDAFQQAQQSQNTRQQLNASLALLPLDATQVDFLFDQLLIAEPQDVVILRDALYPHRGELIERCWQLFLQSKDGRRQIVLPAASALATYAPDDSRWETVEDEVANHLAGVSPFFVKYWMDALRPIRSKLIPRLCEISKDREADTQRRKWTANILADFAADDAKTLADLIMESDEEQFAILFPKFQARAEQGLPILSAEIDQSLPPDLPSSDDKREILGKRQANAAVALLRLNQPEKVWLLFKHSPDPRVRSYIIHRLFPLGADPAAIIQRLDEESDLSVRRALLLALGEFDETTLPAASRTSVLPKVQGLYRDDQDPGLHAAAEWLLRQWNQDDWIRKQNDTWTKDNDQRDKRTAMIMNTLKSYKEQSPPLWYVNTQGQTMVVIPGPVEFSMGSPPTEKDREEREHQHSRRIGRTFAIAAKSVQLSEYRQLTKDPYEIGEKFTHSPDLPVVALNWYKAAAYCNLLSQAEGIPESQCCYEITGKQTIKLKANYLSLTGYRLPTEAEVEYATRAGATTSRFYGETEELLGNYAWYTKSSKDVLQRVGRKKPNDLGLFDLNGNCWTWCTEAYREYPMTHQHEKVVDKEGVLLVNDSLIRVLRGGSYSNLASSVRSSFRISNVPTSNDVNVGFRIAKTIIP